VSSPKLYAHTKNVYITGKVNWWFSNGTELPIRSSTNQKSVRVREATNHHTRKHFVKDNLFEREVDSSTYRSTFLIIIII
jgi:hypothetical protein